MKTTTSQHIAKLSQRLTTIILRLIAITIFIVCSVSFAKTASAQIIQYNDSTFLVSGRIVERNSMASLYAVHVMNMNQRTGTISKIDGRFRILAKENDTIYFSSIGFGRMTLVVSSDILSIEKEVLVYLEEEAIELQSVEIHGKTFAQFREEVLSFRPKPLEFNEQLAKRLETDLEYLGTGKPFAIQGPISFLYENFNEKARLGRAIQRNRERYGNPDDYKDYPIKIGFITEEEERQGL
ncbi:MAG: carboxypeptidase-like regulatory domain-containing protein [Bacteroidales bacterium]|nr:carboxypeptidase-like regulatory domain-containing protein [Bacteroidales bacterium]